MKNKLIHILMPFLFLFGNCHGQQLMKTVPDALKLKEKENLFLYKPLRYLLKEIRPKIEIATATNTPHSPASGYFVFTFVNFREYQRMKSKELNPLKLVIYVKEPFQWSPKSSAGNQRLSWTKEDVEKYGDLSLSMASLLEAAIKKQEAGSE